MRVFVYIYCWTDHFKIQQHINLYINIDKPTKEEFFKMGLIRRLILLDIFKSGFKSAVLLQ